MEQQALNLDLQILVVEDSSFMMKMFTRNLQEIGIKNIMTASNGKEATQVVKENKIDLIISDWNMPIMDGLSFLKYIRLNQKTEKIPFIMATAQGDLGKRQVAVKAGANGHIAKPFNAAQLKEIMETVLGIVKEKESKKKEKRLVNGKVQLNLAHIQITDHLVLGILKHQIEQGDVTPKYFDLNTRCIPGWNPIEKALKENEVDGAFVLAPIAMDLFAYKVPINLILLAHRNGSIMVRSSRYPAPDIETTREVYYNRVVSIPHKMSVHNMLANQFLRGMGLTPGVPGEEGVNVFFEVIPPVQMPTFMKENEEVAGFIVAEPIGSNAIAGGIADQQFLSASIWQDHPCCVVAMQQEIIQKYPDAIYELSSLLVKAGRFAENNKDKAAEIAVSFLDPEGKLGLTKAVLFNVLTDPRGITMNNLYPTLEDLDKMQQYMYNDMGIGNIIDLEKFVDSRFGDVVC